MAELPEIVISGMSGRFPQARNLEEFWDNLIKGTDMVTEDNSRWEAGYAGTPTRKGTIINSLEEFDAQFFNINRKQVERLDPQLRQLLEVTFETLLDSGTNPATIRGRNIGVYVGASSHETLEAARAYPDLVSGYDITGSAGCMLSNRISYAFDLRGPSFTLDTYCSSSLMALHTAVSAIRSGECEGAIVGGVNLLLDPMVSLQMKRLGTLSVDGKCKAFDASADGYVRSEAIGAVFLQKRSEASRSYATIVHTRASADGYKENGVSFPSGPAQEALMSKTYQEAGISPSQVFYVEAHGTGTTAGDAEELRAISNVFCRSRAPGSTLLIGSTKSNMGHAEPAASLCALIKVALSIHHGSIPPNLHFLNPNPHAKGLIDGHLKVVTRNTVVTGSLLGLNATGIGGSNIHAILRANPRTNELSSYASNDLPILVPFSGRTPEAVQSGLEKILGTHILDTVSLLHDVHKVDILGHDYRGYRIMNSKANDVPCSQPAKKISQATGKRSLWLIFPGMGTQWAGMALEMMIFEAFRASLEESARVLSPFGLDLITMLTAGTMETFKGHMSVVFLGMGIALMDLFQSVGLEPDGLIGHSAGELLCAYADGSLSRAEALLSFIHKDEFVKKCSGGAMAAVGLSWEEAKTRCPPEVYPACHNGSDNVTITGLAGPVSDFVKTLVAEGVFAREVATGGVAYHSPYLKEVAPYFEANLRNVIKSPKERSKKWLSTSVPESEWETPLAQTMSAKYIVNNFLSPVYFQEALMHIPENAVVVEIASHALFQSTLGRSLPKSCICIGLLKRGEDNLTRFMSGIGKLFEVGLNPDISKLYPKPVRPFVGGQSLSPLIQWKHDETYPLLDYVNKSNNRKQEIRISLREEGYQYLEGHRIDGRVLFPATGYLVLVWKEFSRILNRPCEALAVEFQNVTFQRATILLPDDEVKFKFEIFENTGEFQLLEADSVVVSGRIRQLDQLNRPASLNFSDKAELLASEEVYKDFRLRGYEYAGLFKGITKANLEGNSAKVAWQENWTSFLDAMIQISIISYGRNALYLPTGLRQLSIDPVALRNHVGDQAALNEVSVTYCPNTNRITCHGVEFAGLKLTPVERREPKLVEPIIEEYSFVPYTDSEGSSWEFQTALKICVDIAVENIPSRVISVGEAGSGKNSTLVDTIFKLIRSNPMREAQSFQKNTQVVPSSPGSPDLLIVDAIEDSSRLHEIEVLTGIVLYIAAEKAAGSCISTSWDKLVFKRTPDRYMWLLRKKSNTPNPQPRFLRISNTSFEWLEEVKSYMWEYDSTPVPTYLVADAVEEPNSGILGLVNCLRKEFGGDRIRCISSSMSLCTEKLGNIASHQLAINVIDEHGVHGSYRHLTHSPSATEVISEYAYLDVTNRGDLSSVKWIQGKRRDDVCATHYASLNFRDIMLAVGKLSLEALPGSFRHGDCVLGLEFAGRNEHGEQVFGAVEAMGLATHVKAHPTFTWTVPTGWSLEEAATVPIAYSTAYYALVVRGKVKTGDSVFITSGSGAVGQAAIRVATSFQCDIFTCVGSEDKKTFLLETFPELKAEQILNSRTTEFEDQILELTAGRGVALILNSLAEEKLQAGIRVLAKGGRFLEIGKFDLSNDASLGMSLFLKNVSFHGILLDALFSDEYAEERAQVVELVSEGIRTGVVKPLPFKVFQHTEAEKAFRFMASGKHIGKIVLKIRDEAQLFKPVLPKLYFDSLNTFIVLGGLGGFGLELADWLIEKGVRRLVLVSRSGVSNGYQKLQISRWKSIGVKVLILSSRLDTKEETVTLIQKCSELGQVGGIFNLAMVLSDGLIENQSPESFRLVMKPKVELSEFLDKTTRALCPVLEYFVCFSSVSSGKGNEGQANYGMANSAMERICENRRRAALPGLAIQWGAIADVGVVHEKMGGSQDLVAGTVPQPIRSCFKELERLLYFQDRIRSGIVSCLVLPNPDILVQAHGGTDVESGTSARSLSSSILRVLGMDEVSVLARGEVSLGQLGADSLMLVELRQVLVKYGHPGISTNEIRRLTLTKIKEMEQSKCI